MTTRKRPWRDFLMASTKRLPGGLASCLLAVACSLPGTVLGQWQLGLGIADEIDGERTEAGSIAWLSPDPDPWEISLGYLGSRHVAGRRVNGSNLWAGVGRRFYLDNWYDLDNLFVVLGLAIAEEDNEVLSDHFQFHTGIGYRFSRRVSVSFRHLSNASISGRNRGDSFLQLEFGF